MMKFFTSDLRRNLIKILCLTTGLSIGLLLVARIYFDRTYDTFFDNADRTYMLYESIEMEGKYEVYPNTSGGYAPALKNASPLVEKASRFRVLGGDILMTLGDGRKLTMDLVCLADSNLFDIFNVPVTGGNPKDILVTAGECVIPRSVAEKIGGDVIGTTFRIPELDESCRFTIAGVYDDFPLNSTIPNAFYFSMETSPEYSSGSDNFFGNDIYNSYVRLVPGATAEDINPILNTIVKQNVEKNMLEQFKLNIGAKPLASHHASQDFVQTRNRMLSLLAAILLLCSGLNFLLIAVGQMGKRAKEMAVRKCYGTPDSRIFSRVMGESLFYLAVSVVIAVALVFCFPDLCSRLLDYTPAQLFTTGNVWWTIAAVCLMLMLLTGAVPAWIYCRTPVTAAFRGNIKSRRSWKLALLSIQFFASAVLLCLLSLVARQYRMISNIDYGYDYSRIAYLDTSGANRSTRADLISELRNLSCVEDVATTSEPLGEHCSGNMVWLNSDPDRFVVIADNYFVNSNLFDMMAMEFLQGETFTVGVDSTMNQVVVEKAFIDVIKNLSGDDSDYIVGKTFSISEHGGEYVICGVVNDIHRGDVYKTDKRAGVWFPSLRPQPNIHIKLTDLSPRSMTAVQEVIDKIFPDSGFHVVTLKSMIEARMTPVRNFATSVMIAGVAILIITLIGLIGYISDEVRRRAKEIAIRKVTGTPANKIISLFIGDILAVALPSFAAGTAVAILAGRLWLQQFSEQVSLSPLSMAICVLILLILITAVIALNTIGVARSNPVEHLRNE
ncbi:MAG: FtsX-like permease family protein [Muribaculaceae bacterium]|nr:FtsX-like permease family protein [Muribaculaceae bacterium]